MKNRLLRATPIVMMILPSLLAGCSASAAISPEDVYRYTSKSATKPAKDLQVEQAEDGTYTLKCLVDNCSVPTSIDLMTGKATYSFDGPGSTNIKVTIGQDVGSTGFAGLTWQTEALINISTDGVIDVDREGVEAPDAGGTAWISKRVRIDDRDAIVMVRSR